MRVRYRRRAQLDIENIHEYIEKRNPRAAVEVVARRDRTRSHSPTEPRTVIRTKSIKSPIDPRRDGLRILATRVRGRGLRATKYDVWMANLAPSEKLLSEFRSERITWGEFSRRYRKELRESGSIDRRNRNIKNHGQKFTLRLLQKLGRKGDVTLLCHCDEDQKHCHQHVLRKVLSGNI